MKILFYDTLHGASYRDKIKGGAMKVCWDQIKYLGEKHDIHVISSHESEKQHPQQNILSSPYDWGWSVSEKRKASNSNRKEIIEITKKITPDLIIDHFCVAKFAIYRHFPETPKIFYQHGKELPTYYFRFTPEYIAEKKQNFEKYSTLWVSVSEKINQIYLNSFHEKTKIHIIDYTVPLKPRENFGVMTNRWDPIKAPHAVLDDYLETGLTFPIKMFLPETRDWYDTHKRILYKPLEKYLDHPQVEILFNQPREVILDTFSRGLFFLGCLNESSPVVATECGASGLAYISQDHKHKEGLGEKEHMPSESIFTADFSDETQKIKNYRETISSVVNNRTEDQRKLSQKLCMEKFSPENFLREQERLISVAMEKYGKTEAQKG